MPGGIEDIHGCGTKGHGIEMGLGQCKWDFTPSPPPDLRLWLENSRNCSWDSPGMYISRLEHRDESIPGAGRRVGLEFSFLTARFHFH